MAAQLALGRDPRLVCIRPLQRQDPDRQLWRWPIDAFDSNGRFIDGLEDAHGKPLVIDGLWTLTLGGGHGSSSDTLYFAAGPDKETNGLFGTITPAPAPKEP